MVTLRSDGVHHSVANSIFIVPTIIVVLIVDQIILGSLQGVLAVLDPGRDVENRYETASLIEQQLAHPVIQVLIGRFISSYDGQVLAVLHPKELVFYRCIRDSEETCRLEALFQHKIKGQPGYNMCEGHFGKSEKLRICVQTINCALHFFESENHILTKPSQNQIHPGPIVYNDVTESILTTCGGILTSVKFAALASVPSSTKNQKTLVDWELNLGDTPVDLKCVSVLPVQPSIMVLCRRSLHCITTGGAIRFTIRLENPAMAMYIQTKGPQISTILATHVRTLLFYHDTTQVWAAQLSFIPIAVELGSFGEGLRNMIVMLSDEDRISIGHLGTEPSLFRMPVTDSRFIDFEARQKELQQYEEQISVNTTNKIDDIEADTMKIQIELKMDSQSNAIDSEEGVPSATLQVIATGNFTNADIFIENHVSVFRIGSEPVVQGSGPAKKTVYLFNMFAEEPVFDHRMTVIALADNRDTCYHHCTLPLKLICEQASAQKSATYKFSLDSSEVGLDVNQLFPEFQSENQTAIGLRPFYSKDVVSVFVSQKANRYRIQSDSPNFCFVVISELVARIKKFQPNAKIHTNSVPMQLLLKTLADYLETEKRREQEEINVRRLSVQMRHVEMVLLQKLKSEHEPPASHINVLVNHTYRELLLGFDRLQALEEKTTTGGQKSLRTQMNLFNLLLELAGVNLPFDGRLIDGTFQKLGDRINYILPSHMFTGTTTPEPVEICKMIVNYCEQGGKLGGIAELEEEEEEESPEAPDQSFIELKTIFCSVPDGSPIDIAEVSKGTISEPCIQCSCQNNSVACSINECSDLKHCPLAIEPEDQGACCPVCRTCTYLGTHRKNEERWKSVQNGCYAMTCKAGIVTTSKMQCFNCPQGDGLRIDGYCCKLCEMQKSSKIQDPCVHCEHVMGTLYHCYRLACPVLDCPVNLIKQERNNCCPECVHPSPGKFRTAPLEIPRLMGSCTFRLKSYPLNKAFHVDSCTRCQCEAGGVTCRRFTCPMRTCQQGARLVFRENVCCPFCQIFRGNETIEGDKKDNVQELFRGNLLTITKATTCAHKLSNGTIQVRKHNTYWRVSDCLICRCRGGQTKCEKENCKYSEPFQCPPGSMKMKVPGQCCPFCQQFEATCSVFGDPHYETFDGRQYAFHGNRNYVLAQECGLQDEVDMEDVPEFVVIAHNFPINDKMMTGRISIILKLNSEAKSLVLQLTENKNLLENDILMKLPMNSSYYSAGINLSGHLEVEMPSLELKVTFDGRGQVQVTLSVKHKGKVCGLCGNFNNDPEDDLVPKYSESITDNIERFGNSWRWKTVKASHKCKSSALTTMKSQDLAQCKTLIDNRFFAFCRKHLHIHKYVRRCTRDVCECERSPEEKPCFCSALESFASECAKKFVWGPLTSMFGNFRQFPVHPECGQVKMPKKT